MRDYYDARKHYVSTSGSRARNAASAKFDRECLAATVILLILFAYVGMHFYAASARDAEHERAFAYKWSRDTRVDASTSKRDVLPRLPINDKSIDAVFTHVDNTDAEWQRNLRAVLGDDIRIDTLPFANRYRNWGELRYAMRSVSTRATT